MKKYYFLIIVALILGLALTGCSLLSNISQLPATDQSGITYLPKATAAEPDSFPLDDYVGLEAIRIAFEDGDGAEFVVEKIYNVEFSGDTEFDQVLAAADWVAYHMTYEYDPDPPGEVWTPSDDQFDEIIEGIEGSGTGDCEDIAILLCALMRFVIGVPANRVWVQCGIVTVPGWDIPPILGHAYLVYKAEKRGIFYIEPRMGGYPFNPYRGSFPSITHWYFTPPVSLGAGESAQHRFNDKWSKGGGDYLHNPNYIMKNNN